MPNSSRENFYKCLEPAGIKRLRAHPGQNSGQGRAQHNYSFGQMNKIAYRIVVTERTVKYKVMSCNSNFFTALSCQALLVFKTLTDYSRLFHDLKMH